MTIPAGSALIRLSLLLISAPSDLDAHSKAAFRARNSLEFIVYAAPIAFIFAVRTVIVGFNFLLDLFFVIHF